MDIERLRTDPAYWDEVAPEGATHTRDDLFYRRNEGRWEYCDPYVHTWRRSSNEAPFFDRLIPRPSKPQWRGPEDGLPPVGTVCKVKPVQGAGWCSGKVVHVTAKGVALYEDRWGDFGHSMAPADFRPLKSDKERAVEAAMARAGSAGPEVTRNVEQAAFERAYDAGLLKLPEDKP